MEFVVQQPITHTPLRTPFVADPKTGLVHRRECSMRPSDGIGFIERQDAVSDGYNCCKCATPALVAPADRIRALLATTLSKH